MTIYALSTGPGISGIAVIRVAGKNTAEVVKKLQVINYQIQEKLLEENLTTSTLMS